MSNKETPRERLEHYREQLRREDEVALAAAILAAFPELTRAQALRRAADKLRPQYEVTP